MPDAAYYRAQAELFRHMARHMNNPEDRRVALAAAERHLARAQELEFERRKPPGDPPPPGN